MPTTIVGGFSALRTNLNITSLQSQTVSTRQANVRAAVAAELEVLDSFLTGSYRRSTMIAPLMSADVDVFVVLDAQYFASGATNVLQRTKDALMKTYTTPKVSRNGQAVTITFKDFRVDVVPAFNRKGGGYLIPDAGSNTWISTDPKVHVDLSATHNAKHDGQLVPVVKMLKGWNSTIDHHFRSFHLEVLAWNLFDGVTLSNDWSAVRYFFDKALAQIPVKLADPSGYGGDVAKYIGTKAQIDAAVSRLDTAVGRAVNGEKYAAGGNIPAAFGEWRKIFGDYFPAYG
jgi:hypothetical protein